GGVPCGAAYRATLATAVVVVAPLLLVIGRGLMTAPAARAFTPAWMVAHVLFLGGTVLMIPAAPVVSHLARDRAAPWLRDLGVALVFLGACALAAQFVVDLAVAVLADGDPQAGGALFDHLQASTAVNMVLYLVGPAVMFVGLIVLGTALLWAPAQRRWAAVVLMVGPSVVGIGRATDQPIVELVGLALIAVAMIAAVTAPARAA
ncbi:MAG TPA: hypothetical protein VK891_14435, partial [Euzebyales bacterium]|nr:hypothetical protein [Euzebyales bacterium]